MEGLQTRENVEDYERIVHVLDEVLGKGKFARGSENDGAWLKPLLHALYGVGIEQDGRGGHRSRSPATNLPAYPCV
jgi:hypothetical protein